MTSDEAKAVLKTRLDTATSRSSSGDPVIAEKAREDVDFYTALDTLTNGAAAFDPTDILNRLTAVENRVTDLETPAKS